MDARLIEHVCMHIQAEISCCQFFSLKIIFLTIETVP